jgi:predicted P-loop ATPase
MAQSIVEKIANRLLNTATNKAVNAISNKAFSAVGWGDKKPRKLMPHELQELLEESEDHYSLNTFSGRQYINDLPVNDLALMQLKVKLSGKHNLRLTKNDLREAVMLACHSSPFSPVSRYLEGLPKWDGIDRIPALFDLLKVKVDDEEHRGLIERALKAFLIAAVARAITPGVKVDSMLILRGATGMRKSTFLQALAVDRDWFSSALLDITNKDGLQLISQYWVFEIAEMNAFLRKPANAVKEFISRTRDDWRAPYAKLTEPHERRVIFVGSTNEAKFLTDPLSNRRFWVVEVGGTIDTDAFLNIRDELWSQAVDGFNQGSKWYLEPADEELMAKKVAKYQV